MEKIEKILTDCIEEIKSGRATLADCLERHRSLRRELEPLLKVALSIREPRILPLDSNYKQTAKAELLRQIGTVKQPKPRSFADIFSLGLPARFVWVRAAVMVVVIVIIISLLAGGTAYASQSSLPGDVLYPVKMSTEDARIWLAGDNTSKAKLNLQFARTRLEEMSKLAYRNREKTQLALNGYRDNLDAAGNRINGITDTGSLSAMLDWALDDLNQQMAYCDGVIDTGTTQLEAFNEANTLTVRTQVELLRILERQDIVRAAQSNINAMQNRLQRALAKAGENQFRVMQQVMLQYQQFSRLGEEILQRAQNMENHRAEVEAMNLQVLPGYLDTIDNIYLRTPQEYRNTVQTCRELTLQFQTQARYRYRYQDGSGTTDEPPLTPGYGEGYGPGPGGQANSSYQEGTGSTDNVTQEAAATPAPDKGQNTDSGSQSGTANGMDGSSGTDNGNTGGGTTPGNDAGPDGGSSPGTGNGSGSGPGSGGSSEPDGGSGSGAGGGSGDGGGKP